MFKNRKAEENILGPEVLKMVIAILCIGLLIFLAVMLYNGFANPHQIEQATSSLSKISSSINYLIENTSITETEVLIESPNKWGIISWPYEISEMPQKCSLNKYCICICSDFGDAETSLVGCDEEGACIGVSNKINVLPEPIEITGPISLKIKLENQEIYIEEIKDGR